MAYRGVEENVGNQFCCSACLGYSFFCFMKVRKHGKMLPLMNGEEHGLLRECARAMEVKAGQ